MQTFLNTWGYTYGVEFKKNKKTKNKVQSEASSNGYVLALLPEVQQRHATWRTHACVRRSHQWWWCDNNAACDIQFTKFGTTTSSTLGGVTRSSLTGNCQLCCASHFSTIARLSGGSSVNKCIANNNKNLLVLFSYILLVQCLHLHALQLQLGWQRYAAGAHNCCSKQFWTVFNAVRNTTTTSKDKVLAVVKSLIQKTSCGVTGHKWPKTCRGLRQRVSTHLKMFVYVVKMT